MKQLMIIGLPTLPECTWQVRRVDITDAGLPRSAYWLALLQDGEEVISQQIYSLTDNSIVGKAVAIADWWRANSRYRMFEDGVVELVAPACVAPHLTASRYKS